MGDDTSRLIFILMDHSIVPPYTSRFAASDWSQRLSLAVLDDPNLSADRDVAHRAVASRPVEPATAWLLGIIGPCRPVETPLVP